MLARAGEHCAGKNPLIRWQERRAAGKEVITEKRRIGWMEK